MVLVRFSSNSEIIVHTPGCKYISGTQTEILEFDGEELPIGMRLCKLCRKRFNREIAVKKAARFRRRQRRNRSRNSDYAV